ncbi:hypothetical protein ACHAWF_000661, partial [Thalassiosira exigua]
KSTVSGRTRRPTSSNARRLTSGRTSHASLRPDCVPTSPIPTLDGCMVLVLYNLKAKKLAGFPRHSMVLCASNKDHTEVKLVSTHLEFFRKPVFVILGTHL